VPVVGRAYRNGQLPRCLAAWLAVLLAAAPLTSVTSRIEPTAVAVTVVESVAAVDGEMVEPKASGARLRPEQPSSLGVLSRLSSLETALGLPPVKSPLIRPGAAGESPLASVATTTLGGETPQVNTAAVGTARSPTGPPA
jgi:hypothetical protein